MSAHKVAALVVAGDVLAEGSKVQRVESLPNGDVRLYCSDSDGTWMLRVSATEVVDLQEGPTMTLQQLADAARWQGRNPCIINTGGGVMALSLIIDNAHALVCLNDGQMSGTEWSVSLDADTRETYGEAEVTAPITSDADQTITDAVAWVRHNVYGDEIAFPLPADALTDKALTVEIMRANESEDWDRAYELSDALERRHAGANERLADKVTGWHMGSADATRWALDWSDCRAWVEGTRNLSNWND